MIRLPLQAPPLQGRGWGGAVTTSTTLYETSPTPIPSPEGEGRETL